MRIKQLQNNSINITLGIIFLSFFIFFLLSATIVFAGSGDGPDGGGNDPSQGNFGPLGAGNGNAGNGYSDTPGIADHPGQGAFGGGSSPSSSSGDVGNNGNGNGNGLGGDTGQGNNPPPPTPTPPTFNGEGEGGTGSSISIVSGNKATLLWSCADSLSSSSVNFSTGGAVSGSTDVFPTTDTTYTLLCSNGGQGTVNITVLDPELTITATSNLLRLGELSVIDWSTTNTNSCAISEDNPDFIDSWSGTSGTQTTSPISGETVYVLLCQTDGGPISDSVKVRLIPNFEEF